MVNGIISIKTMLLLSQMGEAKKPIRFSYLSLSFELYCMFPMKNNALSYQSLIFQGICKNEPFSPATAVSGVGSSPALATCETSQVLLVGVSGGFPGVLPFRPTYRLTRLCE